MGLWRHPTLTTAQLAASFHLHRTHLTPSRISQISLRTCTYTACRNWPTWALVQASLRRTPTERVERMLSLLALIEEGQRAYKVYLERQRQQREDQQPSEDQGGEQ